MFQSPSMHYKAPCQGKDKPTFKVLLSYMMVLLTFSLKPALFMYEFMYALL